MTPDEFLTRVIDEGIAAAMADYVRPDQAERLYGSMFGFEECRGLNPLELRELCLTAMADTTRMHGCVDYWFWVCREHEIEWVCNCYSAVLVNMGYESIMSHQPTARGWMKAAEIVGVSE